MSERETYPNGVPCWVDLLVPEPERAMAFYAQVFGWEYSGPGPMPDGGGYYVAQVNGADVAGIGSAPRQGVPAVWHTYISVDDVADATARAATAGADVFAGPFDALPAGRGSVIAAPDGGAIGLWQAASRQGAMRINEPSAWAMSLLHTGDAECANAFYADVFGWQAWSPEGDTSGVVLYRLPGYVGGEASQPVPRDVIAAMVPAAPPAGPSAAWSVDFWIADADAAAVIAPQAGGSVLVEPHDAPPFRRTVLADPFGAPFSVSQLRLDQLPA